MELVDPNCAENYSCKPSHRVIDHAEHIGAIDLIGVKIFPGIHQILHTHAEISSIHRERGGIKRARRCAADDRKWTVRAARQKFRNRLEHAHLVSGARAAAGEYKGYAFFHSRATRLWPAPLPARPSAFLPARRSGFPTTSLRHPSPHSAKTPDRCSPPIPQPRPPP